MDIRALVIDSTTNRVVNLIIVADLNFVYSEDTYLIDADQLDDSYAEIGALYFPDRQICQPRDEVIEDLVGDSAVFDADGVWDKMEGRANTDFYWASDLNKWKDYNIEDNT